MKKAYKVLKKHIKAYKILTKCSVRGKKNFKSSSYSVNDKGSILEISKDN